MLERLERELLHQEQGPASTVLKRRFLTNKGPQSRVQWLKVCRNFFIGEVGARVVGFRRQRGDRGTVKSWIFAFEGLQLNLGRFSTLRQRMFTGFDVFNAYRGCCGSLIQLHV